MERHKQRGFFVVVVGVEILTLCIIETKIKLKKKKESDRLCFESRRTNKTNRFIDI